jgi:hypothetical protein
MLAAPARGCAGSEYGPPMNRLSVVAAVGLAGLTLVAGCDSTKPAKARDAAVKASVVRGVEQMRRTRDEKELRRELRRTLAGLRTAEASTAAGRRCRRFAIAGFDSTLKGIEARLAFRTQDSGNVEAATRDAKRADRYLKRGAALLREAGRALGIRIGKLNGY